MSDKEKIRVTTTQLTGADTAMIKMLGEHFAKYDVDESEMMLIVMRVGMFALYDGETHDYSDRSVKSAISFSRWLADEKASHEA